MNTLNDYDLLNLEIELNEIEKEDTFYLIKNIISTKESYDYE